MQFKDPDKAFQKAIDAGILSIVPTMSNYAGNFMYMYTDNSDIDHFKHVKTRKYGHCKYSIINASILNQ